jgi:hypothetical protein
VTSSAGDAAPESLDLTVGEPPEQLPLDQPLVVTPGFNPRRVQERVRTSVAAGIVGAVIAETLILVIAYVFGGISAKDLPQVTARGARSGHWLHGPGRLPARHSA